MKPLPKGQNWTTPLSSVRDLAIYEYDMEAAGLSAALGRGLLTEAEAAELPSLPKDERVVRLGLICRDRPEVLEGVESGIREAVEAFCAENGIGEEEVLSVKRDAIYTTVRAKALELGRHVRFRLAARYTSFYNLGDGFELWYSSRDDSMAVKGLGQDVAERHRDASLGLARRILGTAEAAARDPLMLALQRARRAYVSIELDPECYRELTKESLFRVRGEVGGCALHSDTFPGPDRVDPSFNYSKLLRPLIAALV